jgi:hypothetical protein
MLRVAKIVENDPAARKAVVLSACRGVTDALLSLVTLAEQGSPTLDDRLHELRQRHVGIAGELLRGELHDGFVTGLERPRAVARRARDAARRMGPDGAGRTLGSVARAVAGTGCGGVRRHAGHHGFHRHRHARSADHARAATAATSRRRSSARCSMPPRSTSGPTWMACCRPIRAACPTRRSSTRSRTTRRWSSRTSAPRSSTRRPWRRRSVAHPDLDPQHLRARHAGTLICATARSRICGQGHHHHREHRADQPRGRRHDRRAGHRAPPVRRAARRGHLGHPDLAGQLRAFDLLRGAAGRGRSRRPRGAPGAFDARAAPKARSRASRSPDCSILAVVGDGMAGIAGRRGQGVQRARRGRRQRARHRAGRLGAQHLGRDRRQGQHARAARRPLELLSVAAHAVDRRDRPGHRRPRAARPARGEVARLSRDFKLDLRVRGIARLEDHAAVAGASTWHAGATSTAGADPRRRPRAFRRARPRGLPAARGDHRLLGERRGRGTTRDWLSAGIHVVTPNKKANSAACRTNTSSAGGAPRCGSHYLYEATVGAGLPVIQTLRDLRETGDEIRSIEGIFSGTLAYLFNVYDGTKRFRPSCATPSSAATPSPTRATTSRAPTSRAS